MALSQWPASLFYRPKWRKDEARRIAEAIDRTAGLLKFREATHFHGPEDVEFKLARVNAPRVNYDRVFVLEGSPNQATIEAEYAEWGVTVEVVSEKALPAPEPPEQGGPERPDYRKMRKPELRQHALDFYGENLPLSMKVAEIREWLQGQTWPPVVPPSDVIENPEDEL